jgi:hypothetical protein
MTTGGYIIEMQHKITGEKKYVGTVLIGDAPTHRVRRTHPQVTRVVDYENKFFDTLDEARQYGFDSEETATAVMRSLQMQMQTKNINYSVVPVVK